MEGGLHTGAFGMKAQLAFAEAAVALVTPFTLQGELTAHAMTQFSCEYSKPFGSGSLLCAARGRMDTRGY